MIFRELFRGLNTYHPIFIFLKSRQETTKDLCFYNYSQILCCMTKKGKYHLLSYIIDGHLVFYKSQNRCKKLIAFALFETDEFNLDIIETLNEFLKSKLIQYYSVQMSILEKTKKIYVLNFEATRRDNILQFLNIIHQNLTERKLNCKILEGSALEKRFLAIIVDKSSSEVIIKEESDSIMIEEDNHTILLDFFSMKLGFLDKNLSFLSNFIKIIKNFRKKGFLIFNFVIDINHEIKFCLYFTEIVTEVDESVRTERSVNEFLSITVLERKIIKIKKFYNFLWRRGISNDYYLLHSFLFLFENDGIDESSIIKFNRNFERNLSEIQIKFIRFSDNLLLISQNFLFLTIQTLRAEYIQNVIAKYVSKYFIYIIILDKLEYEKLLEIRNLKSLENIQILDPNKVDDFDFSVITRRG